MTPNLLNIHHGFNFRDMGGYQTKSGQTLRMHKVIRSAKLDLLSDRDLNFLNNYGMRYDVDFRSPEEQAKEPDRVPEAAEYYFVPVFPTDETQAGKKPENLTAKFSASPKAGYDNMVETYRDIVNMDNSQKAYRKFFDLLLANEKPDEALLFHCSAGKDRTGMGAVYLLSALGVDRQTIAQDYLAANDYIQTPLKQMLARVDAEGGSANLRQSMTDLWTVNAGYLQSALDTIDDNYGGMQHYLENTLQLTPAQQADLRALYLNE
ncbi:tyrosine-protein phosphatase [Lacticaseibacillus brantae]|uniref:Protein tyrosine serine phosphatase n=1 Tax=Lacticaseibacillus brantae DSM 23927 TaxID=1423727 RepID=A0A0R2B6Z0_9LACO|nr:tyrosine-protein phosphatase [Lacticaseibacillus brantae]KRM72057.1 protein tyrosine serine phosphatase [Lacticaseibacillus brantae DSM 23927]